MSIFVLLSIALLLTLLWQYEMHRYQRKQAIAARLRTALEPASLKAKYCCQMTEEEAKWLNDSRWD